MSENKISRRKFLANAAALSSVLAVPSFIMGAGSSCSSPAPKKRDARIIGANGRVDVAMVGIGNRGKDVIKELDKTGLCNVVALCDVDMGAEHTQEIMSMFPGVPQFRDFRKMFDKMADKIDAVMVATPDHSHFPICMAAMKLGSHVYVEKPLARTFYECELLM